MLGTAIAQILPFAATPILTRIYSEEDFATYTTFFAVATVLNVFMGGRYQYAIVIPKNDVQAIRIFSLSVYITLVFCLIAQIIVLVPKVQEVLKLDSTIYLIPVYLLFFGIWSSFSNLSIRHKKFKINAVSKVFQSFFYVLSSIVLGLMNFLLTGLIIGKITGIFTSWFYLFKKSNIKLKVVKLAKLKEVAQIYKDYPKYGILPAFLNTFSSQAIILVLTKFYSTESLGYFGLTVLVLTAPLALIGVSFKDVFYQKIAFLINAEEDFSKAYVFFKKSVLILFGIGLPICLVIYLLGPQLFSFVFGSKWKVSGEYASILAVGFLIKLVASPLSSVFNALNKLKIASIWQTLYFISTCSTFAIAAYFLKVEVKSLLIIYVVHDCILYLIYLGLQTHTLKSLRKIEKV